MRFDSSQSTVSGGYVHGLIDDYVAHGLTEEAFCIQAYSG